MDLICLNSARQVGCRGGREGQSDHPTPGIRPWKLVSMGGWGHKEKVGFGSLSAG